MSQSYSSLSPKQKQMALQRWHQRNNKAAAAKAAHNPLNQEIAPGLTLGDLNRDTSAATALKYGGVTQQLNALPARTNNWYAQYQQAIRNAQATQQQQYQNAVAGVGQLQAGLNTQAQQAWAGEQAKLAQDAASRGATVDPNLAPQMHGAANVRGVLTDSFGAMLANQGASENANLTNRRLSTGLGRVQALEKIASDQGALAREKGAFKQTYRDQRISDAAKQALENALTQSTLGENVAKTAKTIADTANTRADTTATKARTAFLQKYGYLPGSQPSQLDQAKLDYFNKHGYFPPTGPPKATGPGAGKDAYGNTSLQRTNRTSDFRKIFNAAVTWRRQHPNEPTANALGFFGFQYKNANVDILRGAVEQAINGRVSRSRAKALRRLGVAPKWYDTQAANGTGGAGVTGSTDASGG